MIAGAVRKMVSAAALACAARSLGAQAPTTAVAEPVTLSEAPGALAGTLLVPRASGPLPVVLLIAGSGPTDRDGNGPGLTPASLRFDKRGIAASSAAAIPESQLTFERLADDVAGWVRLLAADHRFSRVIVAGHSEGALLGLVAMRTTPASAYISLEGPARPADEVLHDQLAKQLPAPLLAQSDSILARLKQGTTTDSTPPVLAALFRRSVQPYLISWFRYSGQTEIARITVPCLIVQGSHDLQVAPSEADLLLHANPRRRVERIDGMNHVLKQAPADMAGQMASYRGPDAPLALGLVGAIASFIAALHK